MSNILDRSVKPLRNLQLRAGLTAALAVLALVGCKPPVAKQEANAPVVTQGLAVDVLVAEKSTIENELSLSGVIAPSRIVMAFSKVSGKLVENVVREGQTVGQDEVLARINQDIPGQDYKDYEVKSPIPGVIAKVTQDPGSMVGPSVPVATVIDMDNVKITVNVIEAEIGGVRIGMPAEVTVPAYPERKFRGSVSNILPTVDPMSHAAKVEVKVSNSGHPLKPGMSANVALKLGKHSDVVVIPRDAVIEKMGERYVFLLVNDAVKSSDIQTGYGNADKIEITSGVEAGDRVVVSDQNVLKDGSKARAREAK